jgi:hypothetical protein
VIAPLPPASPIEVSAANHVDLWLELKRRYLALRGGAPGPQGRSIPRTTGHDVLDLATRWTVELMKARGDEARDRSERQRWKECLAEIDRRVDAADPGREYPANPAFWDASNRMAIYLESQKLRPSRWQLVRESLAESARDLPATLATASSATAAAARRFLGDPLKLAALVVGAAVVVPILFARRA